MCTVSRRKKKQRSETYLTDTKISYEAYVENIQGCVYSLGLYTDEGFNDNQCLKTETARERSVVLLSEHILNKNVHVFFLGARRLLVDAG